MPPTDVESPPESTSRSSLEYDRSSTHVTRRQFRIFVWLLFINTLIFAAYVFLPGGSQIIRSAWESFQAKRQTQKLIDQQSAFLQQAGAFTAPADEVIYEENPNEGLKLLNSSKGYASVDSPRTNIEDQGRPLPQRPVLRTEPPIVSELRSKFFVRDLSPKHGTLLLHTLIKPNGDQRLVWITIDGEPKIADANGTREDTIYLGLENNRHITAYLIERELDGPMPFMDVSKRPVILRPRINAQSTFTITRSDTPSGPLKLDVTPKGCFRFYAAQLDPKDLSHFTIDYAIDGQRNTIDGYLKDDNSIIFSPRAGRIVSEGPFIFSPRGGLLESEGSNGKIWNPLEIPATRPSP
jgi:hypothetical protein